MTELSTSISTSDRISLPENFSDELLSSSLSLPTIDSIGEHIVEHAYFKSLSLCHGLILRLRSGYLRIYRRSTCKFPRVTSDQFPSQFFSLVRAFLTQTEDQIFINHWTPQYLWQAAHEAMQKCQHLSVPLQKQMALQPFLRDSTTGRLQFKVSFLEQVYAYHETIRRPSGTFDVVETLAMKKLRDLQRDICPMCSQKRQIYCGPCGGIRMPHAEGILPPRISLPFDVLLLFHYQESLVKCTGIHASVLCEEGSAGYVLWDKPADAWQSVVQSLDPDSDVLLFPYPNSTSVDTFPWNSHHATVEVDCISKSIDALILFGGEDTSGVSISRRRRKWRLVVLEASWQYAKTMSRQIVEYREKSGLRPIPSVRLTNVTGEYWRFHSEGHAAVSTIEAIAHTARAAGSSDDDIDSLLTLFRLQKCRVLKKETGKVPRAVEVSGDGIGSWKHLSVIPN